MIDKVHQKIDTMNQSVGKVTGVHVALPKPSRKAIKISSVTNSVASAGLIAFGILTPYKWTVVAGGVGLVSNFIISGLLNKKEIE